MVSLFLPCVFEGLKSRGQSWQQAPLSTEPCHWPINSTLNTHHNFYMYCYGLHVEGPSETCVSRHLSPRGTAVLAVCRGWLGTVPSWLLWAVRESLEGNSTSSYILALTLYFLVGTTYEAALQAPANHELRHCRHFSCNDELVKVLFSRCLYQVVCHSNVKSDKYAH